MFKFVRSARPILFRSTPILKPRISRALNTTAPKSKPQGGEQTTELSKITFKEGTRAVSQLALIGGISALVLLSGSLIVRELFPTRLSPNSLFSKTVSYLKQNEKIKAEFGEFKAYGKDFNKSKEGRRNFVFHDKFKDLDGEKFTRIKFVIEGTKNGKKAYVYASTSKNKEDEFDYVIFQPQYYGERTIALIDNRQTLKREEVQEKVATKLAKAGMTLFLHSQDQISQRQLIEFGDFKELLNYKFCDKEENKAECDKAQLAGFPVWLIGGEKLEGFQPLEQMKEIAQRI
eukprot:augustus_masked-scaffold_12-processed-gene-3.8-mRNA-1 protein AED:0.14 eAED:0.16 QI:0/-1/0/1/-1/1/1/0/288